ncbi:MAG: SPOR domain-containing protein [Wigglesworthia glossinidia]|nr:SPOR domain-containing protein [Wigglesworthia glossinidia]
MNQKVTNIKLKSDNQNNHESYIKRKNYSENKKLLNKNRFMITASIISISLIVIIGVLLKYFSKKSETNRDFVIVDQQKMDHLNDTKIDTSIIDEKNKENKLSSSLKEEIKNIKTNSSSISVNNKKSFDIENNKSGQNELESNKNLNDYKSSTKSKVFNKSSETNFIEKAPDNYYTIQFSTSSNLKQLRQYAKSKKLNPYWIHTIIKNGNPHYLLVSGTYPSLEEAQNTIKTLPEDLKLNKPWIRKIKQIK